MNRSRGWVLVLAFGFAVGLASSAEAADPSGRWSGNWCSFTNGHHGKIRASVRQIDDCSYQVKFCGTFLGVVPFAYSVPMTVTGQGADGRTILTGQSHLPLFGEFCCRAEVTDCDFIASYTSPKDQGQFTMQRR